MTPEAIVLITYLSAGVGVAAWAIGQWTSAGLKEDLVIATAFAILVWPIVIPCLIADATETNPDQNLDE